MKFAQKFRAIAALACLVVSQMIFANSGSSSFRLMSNSFQQTRHTTLGSTSFSMQSSTNSFSISNSGSSSNFQLVAHERQTEGSTPTTPTTNTTPTTTPTNTPSVQQSNSGAAGGTFVYDPRSVAALSIARRNGDIDLIAGDGLSPIVINSGSGRNFEDSAAMKYLANLDKDASEENTDEILVALYEETPKISKPSTDNIQETSPKENDSENKNSAIPNSRVKATPVPPLHEEEDIPNKVQKLFNDGLENIEPDNKAIKDVITNTKPALDEGTVDETTSHLAELERILAEENSGDNKYAHCPQILLTDSNRDQYFASAWHSYFENEFIPIHISPEWQKYLCFLEIYTILKLLLIFFIGTMFVLIHITYRRKVYEYWKKHIQTQIGVIFGIKKKKKRKKPLKNKSKK